MTKGDVRLFLAADIRGVVLAFFASLSWALYTILSKPLLDKHSSLKVTSYSMMAGSILLGLFVPYFFDAGELMQLSLTGWSVIVFSVLFSIVIAFFLWHRAVAKIGIARTMIYQYCVPAVAAAAAYFVSGETLHVYQLVGGVIIFASVYLARR